MINISIKFLPYQKMPNLCEQVIYTQIMQKKADIKSKVLKDEQTSNPETTDGLGPQLGALANFDHHPRRALTPHNHTDS